MKDFVKLVSLNCDWDWKTSINISIVHSDISIYGSTPSIRIKVESLALDQNVKC